MILESKHGCYGTVYICQFNNEKFDSVIDLKKHIEESIKSRTEVLKEHVDYHCLGIDNCLRIDNCLGIEVLMRTDFPEFTYKFNLVAIELAKLIDEYVEVKEFIDNEDCY